MSAISSNVPLKQLTFKFLLNLKVSEAHITLSSQIWLHALSTTGRAPL